MRKLPHDALRARRLAPDDAPHPARHPIAVLLDNVRSLYNVGSIFRTCDAARVERLLLTGFTPHPPRPEIAKTALGAVESVPWEYHHDPLAAVRTLKASGYTIVAVERTDASTRYDELTTTDLPVCLVFGHELTGVRAELLDVADRAVEIPMYGVKHSLNVAVACGIAVYAALRLCEKR